MADGRRYSNQVVSANLRVFMALNRESHEDVASYLGVSRPALSARLNGHTSWQLEDLDRLADHYGTPPATFLTPPADAMREQAERQLDSRGRRPRTTWSPRRRREADVDDQVERAAV
jgi:transcriptional regulator with XRE-family HTH domain